MKFVKENLETCTYMFDTSDRSLGLFLIRLFWGKNSIRILCMDPNPGGLPYADPELDAHHCPT